MATDRTTLQRPLRRILNVLRVAGAAVSAVLIALVAGMPLPASGEAANGEKPGAAKTKIASSKTAVKRKPAPPLPFLQTPGQKAARAEIEASSLAPALKEKLLRSDPLSLAEIEELGKAGLSEPVIIKCLRSAGGSYQMLTKDIDRLRAAGITDAVLDYLLTTRSRAIFLPGFYYSSPWAHHSHSFLEDLHHSDSHHFDSHH